MRKVQSSEGYRWHGFVLAVHLCSGGPSGSKRNSLVAEPSRKKTFCRKYGNKVILQISHALIRFAYMTVEFLVKLICTVRRNLMWSPICVPRTASWLCTELHKKVSHDWIRTWEPYGLNSDFYHTEHTMAEEKNEGFANKSSVSWNVIDKVAQVHQHEQLFNNLIVQ